jgi:hypothetical protein
VRSWLNDVKEWTEAKMRWCEVYVGGFIVLFAVDEDSRDRVCVEVDPFEKVAFEVEISKQPM